MQTFVTILIVAITTYLICSFIEILWISRQEKQSGSPCYKCKRDWDDWCMDDNDRLECDDYQDCLKLLSKESKKEVKNIKSKKKMRIPKIYRIIIWAILVKLLWNLTSLLINYLETLV